MAHHHLPFYQRDALIYVVSAVMSVFFSAWIAGNASVINPDAICYVLSAEEIVKSGFQQAIQLCPQAKWPLYSFLIYGLAQLTHLSYVTSAYVLDGFFTLLSVVMFIAIIKELGGTRRMLWLSAAVILCAHQFNSVRQYIIRDHGFWAFYLISIWCLLRFFRELNFKSALGFSASLIVATLFRVEGAVFLLLLPFTVWFHSHLTLRKRVACFITLYGPMLVMGGLLGGGLFLFVAHPMEKLGRIPEIIIQVQYGLVLLLNRFDVMKLALNTYALPLEAVRDTSLVLLLMLAAWYFVTVINNLSWVYTLLVGYAWSKRLSGFSRPVLLVLSSYLLINLFITSIFFGENLYLAKRYLIAFSLVLMFWVPFALDRLFTLGGGYRMAFIAALIAMVVSTAGVFVRVDDPKLHVYQGGRWLAQHVPLGAKLFANTQQLRFYSEHYKSHDVFKSMDIDDLSKGKWKQYDYIALVVDQTDASLRAVMNDIPYAPVQAFTNAKGDKVVIYKVQHEERMQ